MASNDSHRSGDDSATHSPVFVTTHWSVVLTATGADTTRAQAALEHLCRMYWYPIYHFVRRQGYSVHDAQAFYASVFRAVAGKKMDCRRGPIARALQVVSLTDLRPKWKALLPTSLTSKGAKWLPESKSLVQGLRREFYRLDANRFCLKC